MAIAMTKYVDITSGNHPAGIVGRRNLCGRVFTTSRRMLASPSVIDGIVSLNDYDEVSAVFGSDSEEAEFARHYFSFISKSVTKAASLSFAYWGDTDEGHALNRTTPLEALSAVNEVDENFGSFCFIDHLTSEQIGGVARANAAYNNKYLYSISVEDRAECAAVLSTVMGADGTVVTLDKFGDHLEFIPMALFAATNYARKDACKNFMFNQFDEFKPSVTSTSEARQYDSFVIVGDKSYCVNYIGSTHQAGNTIFFYQDGYNANGLDTACYCNEVWLKDGIQVNLLNLLMSVEHVPATEIGAAMCRQAIMEVIDNALFNGVVLPLKNQTASQKAYMDMITGDEKACESIYKDGFWVSCKVRPRTENGRTYYYLDYLLLYSKGDNIRKIEGSHAMV